MTKQTAKGNKASLKEKLNFLFKKKKTKKQKSKSPTQKKRKFGLFASFGLGKEKEYFVENLSMLLAAGMDFLVTLKTIKQETRSPKMKAIIEELEQDIEAGSSLSSALARVNIFPDYIISLVRIGEESGKLAESLQVIALQEEKERDFHSRIKSAMMYPVIVLTLTVIVGIGIAWFILPRLSAVFDQLQLELPFITRALIAIGNFLGQYGFVVVPLFLFITVGGIYFLFVFPKTKIVGQELLFKIPAIRNLIREVELARFGYLLGTLLEAGLPVTRALNSLYQATTSPPYRRLYAHLRDRIEEGNSFQKSFSSFPKLNRLITVPVQQMVVSAEQSGKLSTTLLKIGKIFEGKTENSTKNLAIILEPILLVIVWLGVIAVALAVILPIYSLIGGLNQPKTPPPPPPVSAPVQRPSSPPTSTSTEKTNPAKPPLSSTNNKNKPSPPPELLRLLEQSTSTLPAELVDRQLLLEEGEVLGRLQILDTETGFLNVRDEPGLGGKIITTVQPGQEFGYTKEQNGWYNIVLNNGQSGWVFGRYVKVLP